MTVRKVYWLGNSGWPLEHTVPGVVQNIGISSFRAYKYGGRLVDSLRMFFFNSLSGGWSPTVSTQHGGH
jgi:hypothetical protein